jgi:ABC-type sugar transport system ATPase subunit
VTVFRDGQHVGTKAVKETSAPEIIHMMIGRHLETLFRKEAAPIGKIVLEVRRVSKRGLLRDISFSLREGEIVGMAGLVGAGRTELARTIFGDITADEGEILIDGRPVRIRNPREAISHGIGLVPEDRKEQGLVTTMSVRQNISMPQLQALTRLAVLRRSREAALARDYVERLAIKTPTIDQKAMLLSGGNQQRVVIAKWLATRPKVLIVDEPTRGVDVGAKAEIHRLLCDLAGQGMAILLISSDLPEVLAISDRILVMAQGRLSGELSREYASQEAVMQLAMKSHGSAAA